MNHKEQHKRSIVKAVTFRIVVMVSDFVIIMAITRRYDIALGIIAASNMASTFLYYFHERAWNQVKWGRE
jgi:uncharacterized membrane protein